MRIILWEFKKLFKPVPLLLCLATLVLLSLDVPKKHLLAKQLLDTKNYPESFTVYDDYSIDILFHDFLLETYGSQIGPEHLEDLKQRRDVLLDQVDAAARKDPVLLRIGTYFDKKTMGFYGAPLAPMENPERDISEEDQIYEWSCVNGQMKLEGTDYPVGFLTRLGEVIEALQAGRVYHVFSIDLLYTFISNNVDILKNFIFAAWVLAIPYGVSEARSNTEILAISTKQGRKIYRKKTFLVSAMCLLIIGAGVWVANSLFVATGVERYWRANLDFFLLKAKPGKYIMKHAIERPIQYGELYRLLLGMTGLIGFAGAVMIVHISLQCKHAVSTIAYILPVILIFNQWISMSIRVTEIGLRQISLHSCVVFAGFLLLTACIFSTGVLLWKYKKDY